MNPQLKILVSVLVFMLHSEKAKIIIVNKVLRVEMPKTPYISEVNHKKGEVF